MKFEVNKTALIKHLNIVQYSVASYHKTILKNVLIETIDNSTIKLYTTNLIQCCEVILTKEQGVNVIENGSTTVHCRQLIENIKSITDKTVDTVTLSTTDDLLLIECNTSTDTVRMDTTPPHQLPYIENTTYDFTYKVNMKSFINRIKSIVKRNQIALPVIASDFEQEVTENELFSIMLKGKDVDILTKIDDFLSRKKNNYLYLAKMLINKDNIKFELNANINIFYQRAKHKQGVQT